MDMYEKAISASGVFHTPSTEALEEVKWWVQQCCVALNIQLVQYPGLTVAERPCPGLSIKSGQVYGILAPNALIVLAGHLQNYSTSI